MVQAQRELIAQQEEEKRKQAEILALAELEFQKAEQARQIEKLRQTQDALLALQAEQLALQQREEEQKRGRETLSQSMALYELEQAEKLKQEREASNQQSRRKLLEQQAALAFQSQQTQQALAAAQTALQRAQRDADAKKARPPSPLVPVLKSQTPASTPVIYPQWIVLQGQTIILYRSQTKSVHDVQRVSTREVITLKDGRQRFGFDHDALYSNGTEYSFEEVRNFTEFTCHIFFIVVYLIIF
jgi:predicted RNase H-like nuclease (RuvC/YqgF family)